MARTFTIGLTCAVAFGCAVLEADWPQWRGPSGTGVAPDKNLPVQWSATENVAWKAPIAGLGVSTPIVSGNRVFVTSQMGAGPLNPGNHPRLVQGADAAAAGEVALGGQARGPDVTADRTIFVVEAFNRTDGKRLWEYRLDADGPLQGVHEKHNLTTPSPATDGQMVYAWFGTGQLVALDMNGKLVWQRHLGKEIAPFDINWGHTSSPVVYQDTLILLCDHTLASYLLAVDKKTGKDRWKADRGKGRASYSTPLVIQTASGPELIVNSSARVDAYDPRNGTFLWHVGTDNRFPIPMPVFHDGVVYMSRGYRSGPYMAVRPGGRGDVTASHVNWLSATGAPYVSSLVYDQGLLYMANDVGVLAAAEATTGKKIWQERLGGVFSASPVAADGKIYFVSENGETIVLKSGPKPEVLARNNLGERQLASLGVSNGQLFIRSDRHLFCIGKPSTGQTAGDD
jgi:outer membrane protein assembly factor BamB